MFTHACGRVCLCKNLLAVALAGLLIVIVAMPASAQAGDIGATLARRFTRLGHDVVVANSRGPESLAGLAKETGARPVTAAEAPHGRDLVVVTIPEARIPNLPPGLFTHGTGQ